MNFKKYIPYTLLILTAISIYSIIYYPEKIVSNFLILLLWCICLTVPVLKLILPEKFPEIKLTLPIGEIRIPSFSRNYVIIAFPLILFAGAFYFNEQISTYEITVTVLNKDECFSENFKKENLVLLADNANVSFTVTANNTHFTVIEKLWGDSLAIKIELLKCFLLKDTSINLKFGWLKKAKATVDLKFSSELFLITHQRKSIFFDEEEYLKDVPFIDSLIKIKTEEFKKFNKIVEEKGVEDIRVKMIKRRFFKNINKGKDAKRLLKISNRLSELKEQLIEVKLPKDSFELELFKLKRALLLEMEGDTIYNEVLLQKILSDFEQFEKKLNYAIKNDLI